MLKIGIIGANEKRRGGHAFLAHQVQRDCYITAGADLDDDALKNFQAKFGPDTFVCHDYKDLLKQDIDAVFIMTPDFLHEEQTIAALEAGKAVYLEKPLAITTQGCDRILRCAEKTHGKLFAGHNMRYYPSVLKMKEIIDSGIIGTPKVCWCRHFINYGGIAYFCDWHARQKYVNSLLLQKGAHDIDVIHFLMNSHTVMVTAMGNLSVYNHNRRRKPDDGRPDFTGKPLPYPPEKLDCCNPEIDVEDHSMVLMQLANGTQGCYLQCHYTPDAERNYTVIGTRGRLENIGDAGNCRIQVWNSPGLRSEPDIIYQLKEGDGNHGGSDPAIIKAFLDYVQYDLPCPVPPEAARNAVAAGVAAAESLRNGSTAQIVPEYTA